MSSSRLGDFPTSVDGAHVSLFTPATVPGRTVEGFDVKRRGKVAQSCSNCTVAKPGLLFEVSTLGSDSYTDTAISLRTRMSSRSDSHFFLARALAACHLHKRAG